VWGVGGHSFFVDYLWKKSMVVLFFLGSVMSAKTEKINGTAQNQNQKAHALSGHGVANRLTTEKSNL
jgi:hypothetical protein